MDDLKKQISDARDKLLNDDALVEFSELKQRKQEEEILWLFFEVAKKLHKLEKTIAWNGIFISLAFLFVLLEIGHIAHWIW